jgi:hypothetical protein
MKSHIPRRAVSTAEAGLFLASLLVTASVTGAQKAGDSCGTPHDGAPYTWIPIRSSQLSATKGDTIIRGKDGCATSGTGVHAHVSAEMPYGTYMISAVAFRGTAGKATTGLTIMAVTTNSSMLVKMMRANKTSANGLHRCRTQRNFSKAGSKRHVLQCNPEFYVSGRWVVFQAQELTVCDVLICASEKLFTGIGIPLSPKAAMMLSGRNRTKSDLIDLNGRSSSPQQYNDLPGTCPGAAQEMQGVWQQLTPSWRMSLSVNVFFDQNPRQTWCSHCHDVVQVHGTSRSQTVCHLAINMTSTL